MQKVKQDFIYKIFKQNILTFSPYGDYDVVAAFRHLFLYNVILFPVALLR